MPWHDKIHCYLAANRDGASPMMGRSSVFEQARLPSPSSHERCDGRLGPFSIIALSAWCGLVAGLLETGVFIVRKCYFDSAHFYRMSRHFVWLVPLADLLLFVVVGLILAVVVRCGARGQRMAPLALGTLALLPPFWAAFPRIYGAAGLLVAMGAAARLVPAVERRGAGFARVVRLSFPAAACLLMIVAGSCWASDKLKEWREARRPLPSPAAPNVLLIVLDTVAAGHLSLHGYDRPTSPTLDELASRGICFNRAQATTSWTLPSHASMFTGRWPHELSAGWVTPLDAAFPTLAEYLGTRGYATGGFVANLQYCASDSGLARGFTTFRDFIFPELTALYLTSVVGRLVDGIQGIESVCTAGLGLPFLRYPAESVWQILGQARKEAAVVNREFLDWLSQRPQQNRPFFAFLNFYDAHYPYGLPPSGSHRFGAAPRDEREEAVARDWEQVQKGRPSPGQIAFARDSYDDCVADLDERLGELIDELQCRGVLERTWVIITADHGESFGEHPGVFLHGTTLYQTERHVPLVIIPPAGVGSPKVVTQPVSLRDIAATIVDASGFKAGSPFPGSSLAQFWDASCRTADSGQASTSPAFSEVVPENSLTSNPPGSNLQYWPVAALVDGDWTYARREGDLLELLFNLGQDAGELRNLAGDPAMRPTLERMRHALNGLTAGPLTPDRFNP
jgi:arylsulfatase A-like enzyme